MFTIVMNSDKSLSKHNVANIYQREKLVDKIRFLVPLSYCGTDLSDFDVYLKYVDQGNVPHAEKLVASGELYKEVLKCFYLPIDTDLTRFAGDIELRLTLSKVDVENKKHYVLHSDETKITILPLKDYFAFATDESLEVVDRLVGKIHVVEQKVDFLNEVKADNIRKTGSQLQLESNGELIGDSVDITLDDSIIEEGIPVVDLNTPKSDDVVSDEENNVIEF